MSDLRSSQDTTERAAKLPDLQPDAPELSVEDAENVRGGIIVQGGISPYTKVSSTDGIQLINWG